MIRLMISSYYPIRYIPIAESFDLPTRPNSLAVGKKNKSYHDFWIIKCRTQTILVIFPIELAEIKFMIHKVQNDFAQVIFRKPFAHVYRGKKLLV
jgi:hypothetical protein